jgi:hypothetical protein
MLYFVLYLIIGFATTYVFVVVHLIQAEAKGYNAISWWIESNQTVFSAERKTIVPNFMMGIIIWPVRLAEFIAQIPDLYDSYESKYQD